MQLHGVDTKVLQINQDQSPSLVMKLFNECVYKLTMNYLTIQQQLLKTPIDELQSEANRFLFLLNPLDKSRKAINLISTKKSSSNLQNRISGRRFRKKAAIHKQKFPRLKRARKKSAPGHVLQKLQKRVKKNTA